MLYMRKGGIERLNFAFSRAPGLQGPPLVLAAAAPSLYKNTNAIIPVSKPPQIRKNFIETWIFEQLDELRSLKELQH
uniref:CSON006873 protein n=1 Tax=Culicoides sonorensis TaxID=179676 RepID=A0A336MYI6_CULSO